MKITKKPTPTLLISAIALFGLSGVSHAETVFITNNTSPKTLASNESDAAIGLTNGTTNNGLDGDSTGDSTVLAWSADDGGGAITFNSINVSGGGSFLMDGTSMGHGNVLWGANQNWTFTLSETISFDALDFEVSNNDSGDYVLQSVAWKDDAAASGTGWSFTSDGTIGTFSLLTGQVRDFTAAGVSNVAAGTEIGFGAFGTAGGGELLRSFTMTPVPEPSAFALIGLAGLGLLMRRRR